MSLPNEKSAALAETLETAQRIAKKEIPLPKLDNFKSLVSILQEGEEFATACAVLQRARNEGPDPWITEWLATCIANYARQVEQGGCDLPTFNQVKNLLVKELKRDWAFRPAWKALETLVESPSWQPKQRVWIIQQLALCTYKDEEMLPSIRFEKALNLLKSIGLRNPDTVESY